jgi:hypothetical protein
MFQISKSFLDSLGISDNPKAIKLILEEYIYGQKTKYNKTSQELQEEALFFKEITKTFFENYKWNAKTPVSEMVGQNCSDMLVQIGKF